MNDTTRSWHRRLRAVSALAFVGWLLAPLGSAGTPAPVAWAAPVTEPVVAPAAQPAEQARPPIFEDSFVDNRAGWPGDAAHYFDQDGYHISYPEQNPATLYRTEPNTPPRVADVSIEAQLAFIDGSESAGYGVALRSTSTPRRAYRLLIDSLGMFTIYRATESGTMVLVSWRRSPALNQGNATNTIRLVAREKTVSAFLNGQQVATVPDDAISEAGAFDLLTSSGQQVLVQHLVVTAPTEKDVAPLPPGPSLLFQDNFFDNRERWPTSLQSSLPDDATFAGTFAQDGFHLSATGRHTFWHVWPRTTPRTRDIAVEATLTKVDGPDYAAFGIGLRDGGTPDHRYELVVNGEGSFGLFRDDGSDLVAMMPWQRHAAVNFTGRSNTLRLEAKGATLTVLINGKQIGAVQDYGLQDAGAINLLVETGLDVVVRSLTAYDLADPPLPFPMPSATAPAATASPTIAAPTTVPPTATPPIVPSPTTMPPTPTAKN